MQHYSAQKVSAQPASLLAMQQVTSHIRLPIDMLPTTPSKVVGAETASNAENEHD
jgi:hypothetical protein